MVALTITDFPQRFATFMVIMPWIDAEQSHHLASAVNNNHASLALRPARSTFSRANRLASPTKRNKARMVLVVPVVTETSILSQRITIALLSPRVAFSMRKDFW